ncbi:MAG: TolC family protein [Bacteroidetes bacterium]|nr:TolC family protein [Bacteroidota bacterium]MBU1372909.1 TolC family protein [Bacteroidota bacterium]MBU1484173.1 TolC family protein [Bacteroidota bacterium]MBU1759466.1 TolC family protein [Bacteroidota bacterium]MBU2045843.1 TolC family protein [Bacteroidota bacterium]
MKTIKSIYLILFFAISALSLRAQEKLTLQQAITIALENNYDIKLSKNDSEISKNDVTIGNAGMLPMVTGNLVQGNQIQTSNVDLASGITRTAKNAKTTNLNYGANLNWKIFDGFQMFTNYQRLQQLEQLGELNAKLTVQTTIANVIQAYYDLVTQQKQFEATKTALEVSAIRLKNANSRYTLGKGSKLELLAAKVDLNTDTTSLLRQQDLFKSSEIKLNQLLARDLKTEFVIDSELDIDNSLVYADLKTLTDAQNPDIKTASINQKISELFLKQTKGARYPTVSLTSGYNFSRSTSPPTGFALRSNNHGLNYGLTASINIFNGSQQNRLEKNAKLELENAEFNLDRTKQNVDAQLLTAYQNYQTNLQLIGLERSNVAVAKENLDITLEKYKLGSIVPLELREAQRNFLSATARFSDALYQTKIAEIALKEIAGNINL